MDTQTKMVLGKMKARSMANRGFARSDGGGDAADGAITWTKKEAGWTGAMLGHTGGVYCTALSKDGTTLYSGSGDRSIRAWSVATGEQLLAFEAGHTEFVTSLALSKDGTTLYSGSYDRSIRAWSVATGKQLLAFEAGHRESVLSLALSKDGTTLYSSSSDKSIRAWSVATGKQLLAFKARHTRGVTTLAVSKDGTTLYSGSEDKSIRAWSVATGKQLLAFEAGHTGSVSSLALSKDGTTLYSGSRDKSIRAWSVATGKQLLAFDAGHTSYVLSLALSKDGTTLYSGSDDNSIRAWSVATGKQLLAFDAGHTDWVSSLALSKDGTTIYSGSEDKSIRAWSVATGKQLLAFEAGHRESVLSLALSKDGTTIYSGSEERKKEDKSIRAWSVATGKQLLAFEAGHTGAVNTLALSPDGTTLYSGSRDNSIRAWSVATGKQLLAFEAGHADWVNTLAVSKDGTTLYSGSDDKSIRAWSVATGKQLLAFEAGHTGDVTSLALSKDGTTLYSGSRDELIRAWSVATGKQLLAFDAGHTSYVLSLALSKDGTTLYSSSSDKSIRAWSVATGKQLLAFEGGHTASVSSLALSPDGTRLYSGSSDGHLQVWHTRTGKAAAAAIPLGGRIRTLAVPPAGGGTGGAGGLYDGFLCAGVGDAGGIVRVPHLHTLAYQGCLPVWGLEQLAAVDRDNAANPEEKFKLVATALAATGARNPGQAALAKPFFLDLAKAGSVVGLEKCLFGLANVPCTVIPFADLIYEAYVGNSREVLELLIRQLAAGVTNHNGVVEKVATPSHQHALFAADDDFVPLLLLVGKRYPKLLGQFLAAVPLLRTAGHVDGAAYGGQAALDVHDGMATAATAAGPRAVGLWESVLGLAKKAGPGGGGGHGNAADGAASAATGNEVATESATTPFPGFLTPGGGGFLGQLLLQTGPRSVEFFDSIIVHSVILHKWKTFGRGAVKLETALYGVSVVLFTTLTCLHTSTGFPAPGRFAQPATQAMVVLYGACGLLSLREVWNEARMFRHGVPGGVGAYARDVMNWLRFLQVASFVASAATFFAGSSSLVCTYAMALASFFKWVGLFYYLQPVPIVGPLIYMIQCIVWDIGDMLSIMAVVIAALANLLYIVSNHEDDGAGERVFVLGYQVRNPVDSLYHVFRILVFSELTERDAGLGGSDAPLSASQRNQWAVWRLMEVAATFITSVVILNMLIARMSDSYERIQETAEPEERRKKARFITQLEARWNVSGGEGGGDGNGGGNGGGDGGGEDGGGEIGGDGQIWNRFLNVLVERGTNTPVVPRAEWAGVLNQVNVNVNNKVSIVDAKVDAVEAKVDAVEAKVGGVSDQVAALTTIVQRVEANVHENARLPAHAETSASGSRRTFLESAAGSTPSADTAKLEAKVNKLEGDIASVAANVDAILAMFQQFDVQQRTAATGSKTKGTKVKETVNVVQTTTTREVEVPAGQQPPNLQIEEFTGFDAITAAAVTTPAVGAPAAATAAPVAAPPVDDNGETFGGFDDANSAAGGMNL